MLTSIPRRKKHELMLLWCRTPMSVLAKKLGARAGRLLRISEVTTSEPTRETWVSSFIGQLMQENVSAVLIVGAAENDGETDPVFAAIRSAGCSIEVACHTPDHRAQFVGSDCVVIRRSAPFSEAGVEAVNRARVVVVCETESFDGYEIVSRLLSRPGWELIGSHEHVWDACVVFRRIESESRGGWEILDVLHRREGR